MRTGFSIPPRGVSPDKALFDYIAWLNVQGSACCADAAEQNWLGEMLIHELGIRLLGVHFRTFRLTDGLILQVVTVLGAVFLHRAGFRVAPWLLVVCPPRCVTPGPWMAGQRDIVAARLLVAFAVLMRPTYLSLLLGLMVLEWLRFPGERDRRRARSGVCSCFYQASPRRSSP